jgi:hypothetical protein
VQFDKAVIGLACRLRRQFGCNKVKDIVKMIENAELSCRALGMRPVAIREDELTARQGWIAAPSDGWCDPGIIDIMHLLEEIVRIDVVSQHQPVQRGAMLLVELLLEQVRVFPRELQQFRHVGRHLDVDLGEKVRVMGIERVVEIENPIADRLESFGIGCTHP